MSKIRVMLVDDHAVVRMGFRLLLQTTEDIDVVAEAENGEAAYVQYCELAPDVVVMDLAMPGMGGIEAVKRIMARDKNARIVALSAHDDTSHPKRVLKAGALGYISKRGAPEALIDAVRSVFQRHMTLDPQVAQRMALHDLTGEKGPVDNLSEREFEVFLQLARGQSVAQIADALSLSTSTIGTHLYNVKQKLGATNQAELTLIALSNGLIQPGNPV
jgi:two-component system invasion response regulator UvrY